MKACMPSAYHDAKKASLLTTTETMKGEAAVCTVIYQAVFGSLEFAKQILQKQWGSARHRSVIVFADEHLGQLTKGISY